MNTDGLDKKEIMKVGCALGIGHRKVYKRRSPPRSFLRDNKMVDFYMKHCSKLRRKRLVRSALT